MTLDETELAIVRALFVQFVSVDDDTQQVANIAECTFDQVLDLMRKVL